MADATWTPARENARNNASVTVVLPPPLAGAAMMTPGATRAGGVESRLVMGHRISPKLPLPTGSCIIFAAEATVSSFNDPGNA